MPMGDWSAKQERQYEHVKAACMARSRCTTKSKKTSCFKTCERIAASTVNRGIASAKMSARTGQLVTATKVGQLVTATTVAGTRKRKGKKKSSARKPKRRSLGCGCSKVTPAK